MLRINFLIALLIFAPNSFAQPLVLAMVDTAICLKDKDNKNAKIFSEQNQDQAACKKLPAFNRSIHGHFTLETVKKSLPIELEYKLYHFNVFDDEGKQDAKKWEKTLKELEKIKPDLVLMAVGYSGDLALFPKKLPALTVAAAGTVGFGISPETKLWPQSLDDPKLYLVGHFFPSLYRHHAGRQELPKGQVDPDLLTPNRVKFYIPESRLEDHFKGSSRASALAFAAFIKYCQASIKPLNLKGLEACLQKNSRRYEDLRLGEFKALKF